MLNAGLTNPVKFELLIGKSINEASEILETDFNNDGMLYKHIYFTHFKEPRTFYNTPYRSVSLDIDRSDKITSITIHFTKYIDTVFYDSFSNHYGKPSKLLVVEERELKSESVDYNVDGSISKRISEKKLNFREGKFEENPLFIFWNKKEYQIKILNREGYMAVSELTFRLPTDQF